ncbi:hypothetical protein [Litoribacillus peritrichatus]|uniref:Uncharacterized protein n=1 Tax=Litoribacillus peritrichatus TaxID=718191 RepID=A0ABP7M7S2_9GAMM
MMDKNFDHCINIAFIAEEDKDYAAALSYLIKALKVARTPTENNQCQDAINICLNELESSCSHDEDLLVLRDHCLNLSASYLS